MSISQTNKMDRIRTAFEAARAARQKGNPQKALEHWGEVLQLTENATDRDPRQARMASSSESAVVYQELGDLRTAEKLLIQAVELAAQLAKESAQSAPEVRVGDALALASVHVNLAGLYVTAREPERGLPHAEFSLDALQNVGQHPARTMLNFAATLQQGTSHLLLGTYAQAQESLQKATDLGVQLVTDGQVQVLPQLVECGGRLFAAAKAQGRSADALPSVEQVARMATATFEAQGAPALELFVNAQMHRINALLDHGRFAEAEDQLWHMIDGSGQGTILLSAPDFYVSLWKRDDEALKQGGLPREEILESWEDAIDQAAKRDADPLAIEVMRQRFRLHTALAKDETRAFLTAQTGTEKELSPLTAALLRALQGELQAFA